MAIQHMAELFNCSGLIVSLLPTLGVPAVRLGAATVKIGSVEEPVRNIMLRLTQLFNITGHPAITLPCGKTADGLPIGLQVVGRRNQTSALIAVAQEIESLLTRHQGL